LELSPVHSNIVPKILLLNWFLTPATKPRVSVVSYLNTVPLVWGMLHGEQRGLFDLSFAIPAECADRLESGLADIGIVPAVELNRQKLEIVRGAGIACHGPVRSIFLISKVPYGEIRKLAADSTSRTSVALSRVILARKYGVQPEVRSHAPHLPSMLENADAALIIGDAALVLDPDDLPFHVLDLGAEWVQMTGLPMVFAVWAARAELPAQDPKPFLDSMLHGLAHIDDIAAEYAPKLGIQPDAIKVYLTQNVDYSLDEENRRGLRLFYKLAHEAGIIPTERDLYFA